MASEPPRGTLALNCSARSSRASPRAASAARPSGRKSTTRPASATSCSAMRRHVASSFWRVTAWRAASCSAAASRSRARRSACSCLARARPARGRDARRASAARLAASATTAGPEARDCGAGRPSPLAAWRAADHTEEPLDLGVHRRGRGKVCLELRQALRRTPFETRIVAAATSVQGGGLSLSSRRSVNLVSSHALLLARWCGPCGTWRAWPRAS
jgi:hypothetical protein